jgi:hypothetical protein
LGFQGEGLINYISNEVSFQLDISNRVGAYERTKCRHYHKCKTACFILVCLITNKEITFLLFSSIVILNIITKGYYFLNSMFYDFYNNIRTVQMAQDNESYYTGCEIDWMIFEDLSSAYIFKNDESRPLNAAEKEYMIIKMDPSVYTIPLLVPIDRDAGLPFETIQLPNPCTTTQLIQQVYDFYQTPVDQEYLKKFEGSSEDNYLPACRESIENGDVVKRFQLLGLEHVGFPGMNLSVEERRCGFFCNGLVRFEGVLVRKDGPARLMLGS